MSKLRLSIGLGLLLGLVGTLPSGWSQEVHHAPTVEQCRADQRLWLSKLEGSVSANNVSFPELLDWNEEMLDCMDVDRELEHRYSETMRESDAQMLIRLKTFLDRHHQFGQFIAEDAEGKR